MMIHGCVVEDHCDIIPFLLASWRAKKLPIKNACMIHFDSHPDLSIPKQNMKTWSNLKQVYELLDPENGISEFLVPLLAEQFVGHLIWIRPPWCDQLPLGSHSLQFGSVICNSSDNPMHAGLTATTLREAYYVDDGLVFDSSELDGMTEWPTPRLHVDQLQSIINTTQIPVNQISSSEPTVTVKQVQDNSDHWILDICLDYFSTYNPFRTQMQALIEVDLNSHRPSISGSYTGRSINSIEGEVCPSVDMIVNCAMDLWRFLLVRSPEYLHSTDTSAPLIRQLHSDSLHALRSLLLSPMPRSDGAVDSNGGSGDDYGDHQKVPLKRPRLNTEIATPSMDSTLNDFYEAVPKLYAPNNWVPIKHSATILRKWLSEPSLRFISESEFQLLLPHHRSELTEIDKLISDLVTYVKALPERTCESAIVPSISHISTETTENTPFSSSTGTRNLLFQSPPSVITMARSAVDGFTPTDQETYIFNAVVRAINDELVPFWSELTNKSITFKLHDLCVDDVYREAFQLYLHHVARIAIK